MLSLVETQSEMRAAILAAPSNALLAEIVGDPVAARRRLAVHRDHYRISLRGCLSRTYPATRTLLGERVFDSAAACYVAAREPRDPRLGWYGREFDRFLPARCELEAVPYVLDVASLERTMNEVLHSPRIATLDRLQFERAVTAHAGSCAVRFSPGCTLFESEWPVHTIRKLVLVGADADAVAPLLERGQPARLLLFLDRDGDVCELALVEAGLVALRLLRRGRSIAHAARAARALDSTFSFDGLCEFIIEAGLVAGVVPLHAPDTGALVEG